jgi:cytochrome P450 family 26 subfamily A
MDKDIFENPQEFDPSRFENQTKPIPPFSYLPFGAGVHNCIGNEFARVETLTTIHNFVKLYEWSQLNPEETITRQPMPYPSLGLPIKIKPRCNNMSS